MRKIKTKLLILFFGIVILSFVGFGIAYFFLSSNFVKREAGQNFTNSASVVATELNTRVANDYASFSKAVDECLDSSETPTTTIVNKILDKSGVYFDIKYVDEIKAGYATETEFVINNVHYTIDTENNKQLNYKNEIGIYKLSNLLIDNPDTTLYMVYRYRDCIMYFDANDFVEELLNSIVGMDSSTYLIMETDTNILLMEDNSITNKKIYTILQEDSNFKYKITTVTDDLAAGRASYGIFNINDVSKFLVYAPVFSEILEKPLYIAYLMDYTDATASTQYVKSMNYLKYSIIVVFTAELLFLATVLYFVGHTYVKKEHDFQLSRLALYYIKPYSILCNKHGDIIGVNKTFKTNVNEFFKYKTIEDFEILDNNETQNVEYLKKQKSFVGEFESVDKNREYLRFFPVKNGRKYSMIGENCTNEQLEAINNKRVATFNTVTNLPNKLVLDKALNELCASNVLDTTNNCLLAIDIVDFNKINKLFGFEASDNMLRVMSSKVKESFEGYTTELYNIRTSLFILLIRNVPSYSEILLQIKTVLQQLDEPIEIKQGYLTSVDIRMGLFDIETSKMDEVNAQHIYESAITALDRARNTRLTKFAVYSSDFGKLLTRDQIMEHDLRTAIDNNEFLMFFQPQYNTKSKRIVGFEALIRWNNPKYIQESPEHWISISEKNGMITEIGRFVIEETFKFAKLIEKTGIHISMNVSPVQLLQSGFVNDLIDSFKAHKLKPGSIAIEITETFLMENSDTIISKLKLLRETGFSIHLDDFGIGYSSMLYLKDLPIDTIKIDKEFTKHMMTDKFSRVIVTKVIQIALNLNLNIIAEGVETDKQADILLKAGCEVIQGWLISRAVCGEDAINLIKKYIGEDIGIDSKKSGSKKAKSEDTFEDDTKDDEDNSEGTDDVEEVEDAPDTEDVQEEK